MLLSKLVSTIRISTLIGELSEPTHLSMTDSVIRDLIRLNASSVDPRIQIPSEEEITGEDKVDIDIPDVKSALIALLCKKDIYYRMATGEARNYPLTAEGASIRKDYIFEHYLSLVRLVTQDFNYLHDMYIRNGNSIKVGNLTIARHHVTIDSVALSEPPKLAIYVDNSVGGIKFRWEKLHPSIGYFYKYALYLSDSQIYNSYRDELDSNAYQGYFFDINRTSYEFTDLTAGTYHLALVAYLTNGVRGVTEITVVVE